MEAIVFVTQSRSRSMPVRRVGTLNLRTGMLGERDRSSPKTHFTFWTNTKRNTLRMKWIAATAKCYGCCASPLRGGRTARCKAADVVLQKSAELSATLKMLQTDPAVSNDTKVRILGILERQLSSLDVIFSLISQLNTLYFFSTCKACNSSSSWSRDEKRRKVWTYSHWN
jgi:hypothetical protein